MYFTHYIRYFAKILDILPIISEITIQGGPSGRGQPFVDFEIRVAFQYRKFVLQRNFEFDVNNQSSSARWATL